jgi:hypothetical protein
MATPLSGARRAILDIRLLGDFTTLQNGQPELDSPRLQALLGFLKIRPVTPVPGLPEGAWGMAAAFDTYDSPVDMDETAAEFGVRLTSLAEVARMAEVI